MQPSVLKTPTPTHFLALYEERLALLDAYLWRFLVETDQAGTQGRPFRSADWMENEPIDDTIERCKAHWIQQSRSAIQSNLDVPLLELQRVLGLSELAVDVIVMALGVELDRKYAWIYGQLLNGSEFSYPTLEIVMRVLGADGAQKLQLMRLFQPDSVLCQYVIDLDPGNTALTNQRYRIEPGLLRFLLRLEPADKPTLEPFEFHGHHRALNPLVTGQALQNQLQQYLDLVFHSADPHQQTVIRVTGDPGTGKRLHVLTAMHALGRDMVAVTIDRLMPDNIRRQLRLLKREALLRRSALAVWGLSSASPDDEALFWDAVASEWSDFRGLIVVTTREARSMGAMAAAATVYDIEVPRPTASDRAVLWRWMLSGASLHPEVDLELLADKFELSPGQTVAAAKYAEQHAAWSGHPALTLEDLNAGCYRQLSIHLGEKAERMEPRRGLDSVILPEAQRSLMQQACHRVGLKSRVMDGWGFSKRLSYGTGVSLLFAGPPGTGKTMAAEALGYELGMPVYRIDLSQVVSKYIGETEKSLWAIFEEAKHGSAILFFDEADALFGKRTEMKDSHDKYANVETAFLLQKMEAFDGLSVLATNILQNIDEAFIRRFTYVIRFPFPDKPERERIWRGMFPSEVPLADDVDIAFLADRFQIAGGLIKNIALASCFLAMSDRSPVSMTHILRAVRDELNKTSNAFRADMLGPYADLL